MVTEFNLEKVTYEFVDDTPTEELYNDIPVTKRNIHLFYGNKKADIYFYIIHADTVNKGTCKNLNQIYKDILYSAELGALSDEEFNSLISEEDRNSYNVVRTRENYKQLKNLFGYEINAFMNTLALIYK